MKNQSERKDLLATGVVLYQIFRESPYASRPESPTLEPMERTLRDEFEQAKVKLDRFLAAKAAAIALDRVLPGWVEVDASSHLPKEKWRAFVSNDKKEWLKWLLENGVPKDKAEELIADAFGRLSEETRS